jgi:hypothetical protein
VVELTKVGGGGEREREGRRAEGKRYPLDGLALISQMLW